MQISAFFRRLFGRRQKTMHKETYVIVGLGNPGPQYAASRHNCGFQVVRRLSDRWSCPLTRIRCKGAVGETTIGSVRVVLCQPQTYMNLSGMCVAPLIAWYKIPLDHLLVVYDDVDLPLGQTRLRSSGSAGTHNGMRSILQELPSGAFPRLRVGVGAKPDGWDLADWVLSPFRTREEQQAMDRAFDLAADTCEVLIKGDFEGAMRLCNARIS